MRKCKKNRDSWVLLIFLTQIHFLMQIDHSNLACLFSSGHSGICASQNIAQSIYVFESAKLTIFQNLDGYSLCSLMLSFTFIIYAEIILQQCNWTQILCKDSLSILK